MNIKTHLKSGALLLITVMLASPSRSSAAITIYTDLAAWQAAVGSYAVEPFNPSGFQSFTLGGGPGGSIGPSTGVLPGSVWRDSVAYVAGDAASFSYAPGPLMGAGMFVDTSPNGDGFGLSFEIYRIVGGSEYVSYAYWQWIFQNVHGDFIGWTSTTPFTSFKITSQQIPAGGEQFNIDNLHFAPVPEPSSVALLALGLAGCSFVHIRRRSHSTKPLRE